MVMCFGLNDKVIFPGEIGEMKRKHIAISGFGNKRGQEQYVSF